MFLKTMVPPMFPFRFEPYRLDDPFYNQGDDLFCELRLRQIFLQMPARINDFWMPRILYHQGFHLILFSNFWMSML